MRRCLFTRINHFFGNRAFSLNIAISKSVTNVITEPIFSSRVSSHYPKPLDFFSQPTPHYTRLPFLRLTEFRSLNLFYLKFLSFPFGPFGIITLILRNRQLLVDTRTLNSRINSDSKDNFNNLIRNIIRVSNQTHRPKVRPFHHLFLMSLRKYSTNYFEKVYFRTCTYSQSFKCLTIKAPSSINDRLLKCNITLERAPTHQHRTTGHLQSDEVDHHIKHLEISMACMSTPQMSLLR